MERLIAGRGKTDVAFIKNQIHFLRIEYTAQTFTLFGGRGIVHNKDFYFLLLPKDGIDRPFYHVSGFEIHDNYRDHKV